jgi:hypothetical protein
LGRNAGNPERRSEREGIEGEGYEQPTSVSRCSPTGGHCNTCK